MCRQSSKENDGVMANVYDDEKKSQRETQKMSSMAPSRVSRLAQTYPPTAYLNKHMLTKRRALEIPEKSLVQQSERFTKSHRRPTPCKASPGTPAVAHLGQARLSLPVGAVPKKQVIKHEATAKVTVSAKGPFLAKRNENNRVVKSGGAEKPRKRLQNALTISLDICDANHFEDWLSEVYNPFCLEPKPPTDLGDIKLSKRHNQSFLEPKPPTDLGDTELSKVLSTVQGLLEKIKAAHSLTCCPRPEGTTCGGCGNTGVKFAGKRGSCKCGKRNVILGDLPVRTGNAAPSGALFKMPLVGLLGQFGDVDSLTYRIEALKVFLEHELGLDNFLLVYRRLHNSIRHDHAGVYQRRELPLESLVSSKAVAFLPLVHRLIEYEEQCFGK
jgi:hypothetical protein